LSEAKTPAGGYGQKLPGTEKKMGGVPQASSKEKGAFQTGKEEMVGKE